MYDFLEITVPFKSEFVTQSLGCGYVNYEKLSSLSGLKVGAGDIEFGVTGNKDLRDLYIPWQKIPSSYTDIACKVFDANPACNCEWGYLRFKASPAKIMQGHNVYGSDNLRNCVEHLMFAFLKATPDLFDSLEWGLAELSRIDATYSIQFESRDVLAQAVNGLRNVSNRYLRPSNRYINKTLGDDCDASVYWSAATGENPDTGRTKTLLFYVKDAEIKHQLSQLQSRAKKERTHHYDHIIAELSSHELQDFVANRGRFEGRGKKRYIQRVCGSSNVWAVIRYAEQFEQINGYSFCEYLFKDLFGDLFLALEGNEIEVFDDHKVKHALYDMYQSITPKGNISYAKADRIFRFYMSLCDRGYHNIKRHTSKATLSRNMKELCAIGLSKADLQNLHNGERMKLSKVIHFDFDNQRPANYVEPKSPFADGSSNYLAEIFGVSYRLSHDMGLTDNPSDFLHDTLRLPDDFDFEPLLDLNEIPISPRESMTLVIWPDGEIALTRHRQKKFKPNIITGLINPEPSRYYQAYLH
ncbi:phage/plasmid replication protein, II/X family [Vibrio mangrovi]|uniref:Phage replication protein CRI n=1 Tax=Vibrio mangrovi TaxID=474394 RepID=A0A1Y6ISV6_9VIBR|nr:phage/plasmid replication protein, II/X family [Vibrio mangrovi]MDW6004445.1 phage/plasmid replication protein, II/X family [Vibrio mangrovi]MDW6004459.1 phage/plasmid replication protein, II/X family [Vibrio mangrovi]SMS00747.1 Phage replication protein CRI [Vibrio mangrovi]